MKRKWLGSSLDVEPAHYINPYYFGRLQNRMFILLFMNIKSWS